jgi:hypothetical protein
MIYKSTATLFLLEVGEDKAINLKMYGDQLTVWLKAQLEARGYDIEPIIEKDWGYCLMCFYAPFLLYIGYGNQNFGAARPGDSLPAKKEDTIFWVWGCVPEAEAPFWKRIFRKSLTTSVALSKLDADLRAILHSDPEITLIAEVES